MSQLTFLRHVLTGAVAVLALTLGQVAVSHAAGEQLESNKRGALAVHYHVPGGYYGSYGRIYPRRQYQGDGDYGRHHLQRGYRR